MSVGYLFLGVLCLSSASIFIGLSLATFKHNINNQGGGWLAYMIASIMIAIVPTSLVSLGVIFLSKAFS